ncbi:MAG: glycosyltransferase family 9 protein [Thermodesulfobacteriota bacterium]
MLYILISLLIYPLLYLAALTRRRKVPRAVLIIQTAKIGDMVCSTAVFRALRQRFPEARIAVLADPGACGILESNPCVDEIIPVTARELKGLGGKLRVADRLRSEGFNISVTLMPNVANTIVPFWALIPRRLTVGPDSAGLTFRLASLFHTTVAWHHRNRSVATTYAELLEKGLSIPADAESERLEVAVTGDAMEKSGNLLQKAGVVVDVKEGEKKDLLIGMAPAARNKLKEVSPKLYAEVADKLIRDLSARVVLIGGRGDHVAVGHVVHEMKCEAIDMSGRFTLSELPSLLARMDLFISVDSGPVYMAVAMGVPTVNMAGPCAMEERPLGDKNIVIQKDLPCSPCSYTFKTATTCHTGDRECVTNLTSGPVIAAAKKLLEDRARGR